MKKRKEKTVCLNDDDDDNNYFQSPNNLTIYIEANKMSNKICENSNLDGILIVTSEHFYIFAKVHNFSRWKDPKTDLFYLNC